MDMMNRPAPAGEPADVVIDVADVQKKFRVYLDKGSTLKERILFKKRSQYEDRWVLRGISFQVHKGEAVGLIGHNGCGKSTTLKLLTRILYPDEGTITMKGRVSSLIELGAGFHPDMSGRENIYTNASIFGLTKAEIDRRLEDIIAFSELEQYIDNPVRTYSSGMYMRLAFAVAINVDADILLIDEILAVGDAAFQAKCFNKLKEIKAQGTTIVIVSHSMGQIEQICDRSIWIHEGLIKMDGVPREISAEYMAFMSKQFSDSNTAKEKKEEDGESSDGSGEETNGRRWGSGEATMRSVQVLDAAGNEAQVFSPADPVTLRITYETRCPLSDVVVGLAIYRSDQLYIYGTNTMIDYAEPVTLKDRGYIDLCMDHLPLAAGKYVIDLAFHRPDGFNYDFWREVCTVTIEDTTSTVGVIHLPHHWEIH